MEPTLACQPVLLQQQSLTIHAFLHAGFPSHCQCLAVAGPQEVMVTLLSAGSPGAAGDGQSRKAGVPGGERGSPALLRRVVLHHYPPLPPVKLRGGTL